MIGILIFTITALILGTLLVLTDNHFKKEDDKIEQNLPGYNCGVCGFGSCAGMKEAILENPENYKKCKLLKNQESIKYFESLKNKGFTLVELLAVIIILGVLSVIIVPKIQKSIKDSKKSTYEASAYALDREADVFYSNQKMNQNQFDGCEYNFTTNNNTCEGFEFKGKRPEAGGIKIYSNGETAFSLKFDDNWYTKRLNSNNVSISEQSSENILNIPEPITSGDGLYISTIKEEKLIYKGSNPNNYINLKEDGVNNTLYRIVSYEPDGTIKVVRDERILREDGTEGGISWDTSNARKSDGTNNTYCTFSEYGCNVWGNSSNTLYNGESLGNNFHYSYYNSTTDTTLTNGESGSVTDEATLNKYLNGTWLNSINISNYIENHKFNVGGVGYPLPYTIGDKGLQKEKDEESLYTWNGKIGLMNITEYAEASLNSTCDIFINFMGNPIYNYKDEGASYETVHEPSTGWPCKESNWTFKTGYHQWSISPFSSSKGGVWFVSSQGYFYTSTTSYDTISVRPAFYLKSSVVLAGSGTEADPFYIVE